MITPQFSFVTVTQQWLYDIEMLGKVMAVSQRGPFTLVDKMQTLLGDSC